MAISRHKRFPAPSPKLAVMILAGFFMVAVWFFSGQETTANTGTITSDSIRVLPRPEEDVNPDVKNEEPDDQQIKDVPDGKTTENEEHRIVENDDQASNGDKKPEEPTEGLGDFADGLERDIKEPDNKTEAGTKAELPSTTEEPEDGKAEETGTTTEQLDVDIIPEEPEDDKAKEPKAGTKTEQPDADSKTKELDADGKEQPEADIKTEEPETGIKTEEVGKTDEGTKTEQPEADGKTKESIKNDQSIADSKMEGSETEAKDSKTDTNVGEPVPANNNTMPIWKLCAVKGAQDYIPCLDNEKAIRKLRSRSHFQHRERHCPVEENMVKCLVPLPQNYKKPVPWPKSRDEIWFDNVPHPGLVTYKKDQSWVKRNGDRLIFPGTGTQFILGAMHYIDYIEKTLPDLSWGKRTRVVLDVGCGVASFGGYLFQKDVLTMSFAPKDEHEAQVQLALERGIPAISSVMGTQRLAFPANVYDVVHCARCRVPWHENGGMLLLEVNRVLRPGGYFVWSDPPVYRTQKDQVQIWKDTSAVAASMCWNQVARTTDDASRIGVAIFQKPETNFCYENRRNKTPPLCEDDDKRDAAWYVPMKGCIHKVPVVEQEHGKGWPEAWPSRVDTPPSWLNHVAKGIYGKRGSEEFQSDTEHWKHVVERSYLSKSMGLDWDNIRNIMDMKAAYGGFAAALSSKQVWVMNVVPIYEPDTLPVIFDRGLVGIYHDWCESFSTYPRTYDLIHADHLLSGLTKRCKADITLLEMDRILRPEGYVIFRDKVDNLNQVKPLLESLRWKVHMSYTRESEELLVMQKQWWRPEA